MNERNVFVNKRLVLMLIRERKEEKEEEEEKSRIDVGKFIWMYWIEMCLERNIKR